MKEKKKDFLMLLDDLCYIYKDYVSKNTNSRIEVYVNDDMIKMYLINDKEIVDEFGLAFNHKEKSSYIYISIALMKMLFDNKIIYNKKDSFFDDIDKASLKMVVSDEDVYSRMISVISIYRDMDFYDKIDNGRRLRNKINRNRSASYMNDRVNITRKLLKTRGRK